MLARSSSQFRVSLRAAFTLLAFVFAGYATAQTLSAVINPGLGVYAPGVEIQARIDSASVSGVVISVSKRSGNFLQSGVLRLCRGQGNTCERVLDVNYVAGVSVVTFPSFTPRVIRQDYYYVQRVDAAATATGGLDPNVRSGSMIVVVDQLEAGRENVAQVSVSGSQACAVTTSGAVKCWYGGDTPAALVGAPTNVAKVALGSTGSGGLSCLLASGQVYCWGTSVGDGTSAVRSAPVAVGGIPGPITDLVVNRTRACALSGTTVWCWRDFGYEVQGGSPPNPPLPATLVPVAVLSLGSTITELTLGLYTGCALSTSGAVACWGTNAAGGMGTSIGYQTRNLYAPQTVVGVTAAQIAFGAAYDATHVCAITFARSLLCWGDDSRGQLGRSSTTTPSYQPALADKFTQNADGVMAANYATCIIALGGRASCIGINNNGRLGVGGVAENDPTGGRSNVVTTSTPVQSGDGIIAQASMDDGKFCLAMADGSLRCAGPAVTVNTQSIRSATPLSVDGFGPSKSVLPAPTITSISRTEDVVNLRYQDAAIAPIIAHVWACYPTYNGNLGNAAEIVANEPPSTEHLVQATISSTAGPWSCKVRYRTADGVSAWSAYSAVPAKITSNPVITSAIYDGEYATVTWRDNNTAEAGPVVDSYVFCPVQWQNAATVSVPGCEPQNSRCSIWGVKYEPTNSTHVTRLRFPPATDFSRGVCRVSVYTMDGGFTSADAIVVVASSPAPTITAGRSIGTQGSLMFSDNRSESAGTILSAVYQCTRTRDNVNLSGAIPVNRPANSQHTIAFPLASNNLLQDPDTYSCKVRVTPSVGTVSPDSAAFVIGPNSPPIVSNFSFTATNGVISGTFDISDPEGDQVKNVIAYFGASPRSMECSSGVLGAGWDVPRAGGRVPFTASAANVGCSALTAGSGTIYGFVTAQDVNGLYATIVDAQATNTPPAPVPVVSGTTYSFVFDAVPTTLAVRQPAQDITIRVVDQMGVTATQFNGPARITLSVSGVTSDFEDPNQPAAQQSAHRTVWLKNGVGRIRAFRVNEPSVVRIVAVARADSGFNLQVSATPGTNGLKSALAVNMQTYVSGASRLTTITGGTATSSSVVTLVLSASSPLHEKLRADIRGGTLAAFLKDAVGNLQGPGALSSDGLSLTFGSNRGEATLVFKRNGAVITTRVPYVINVDRQEVRRGDLDAAYLPSDTSTTRRRVLLLHGVFGSTLNTSLSKCVSGKLVTYRAVAPEMPSQLCSRSPSGTGNFPSAECQNLKFVCYDGTGPFNQMLWEGLEDTLQAAGYDVIPVAYDWRVQPASAALDYLAPAVKKAFEETLLPVDIVAHSMGGIVAMNLLENSPYRSYVDRVVLLGTPQAGSVNAYGLMEVADPLGVDGTKWVAKSFYAATAEKLWASKYPKIPFVEPQFSADGGMSGSATFIDVYSKAASTELRRQAFAEAAPSGFNLYPDVRFLPFTGAKGPIPPPEAHVPPQSVRALTRVFGGPDAPNNFGFGTLSAYAECSSTVAGRNASIVKSRISVLYSTEFDTKSVINWKNGQSLNTSTAIPSRFSPDFVRVDTVYGDGTVPYRGQMARFAYVLGLSGVSSLANCYQSGNYGDHAGLTSNSGAIMWTLARLPYPGLASASAPSDTIKVQQATASPTLSLRADTANEVTASVIGLSTFGSSRFLTNPAAASGLAGLAGTAYADPASTTLEIANPPVGQSVITLSRQNAETVTLDRVKVSHTDATPTTNQHEIAVLVRGTQSTGIEITSSSLSSQLVVKAQGPDPVTNLRAQPTSVGTTLSWSPPSAGVAVAGYRIYASRPHEETWALVGAVAAGTTSYVAPFPAASQVQQEIAFVVVSADAQDRYSEVLDFANNRVRDDVEGSFGSGRGNPGTIVLSSAVPMPNNVAISASVTGGEASVNGGAWLSTGLLIPPFANVQLRGVASSTASQWTTVTLNGPTTASSFSILAAPPLFCRRPTRAVVESGAFIRYLDGISGTPLMQGLYPAAEVSPTAANALITHYSDNLDAYDFNGDGFSTVDVDGLLYARYALGFRDAGLVAGIAVGNARTTTQIQAALAQCQ